MPENQNIEYKSSWHDEYLKWICGFANAQGGTIFIGKDDNGKVVGISNSKSLLEEIPNKVRDLLGIMIDVNLCTQQNKDFLEIVVEPHPNPVNYKGQYFYRSGSTKQELKGNALNRFVLQKTGIHWDGIIQPNLNFNDLDSSAFDVFRKLAMKSKRVDTKALNDTNNSLLKSLRLSDDKKIKRAAALLFHNDPEKFVTGAYIKIGFFESKTDLLYQDEIHGNLFTQVDKSMDILLTKYLKAIISYERITRVETYPIPESALREALLNAVAHKDYSSGNPIQISVYNDKIIVWNDGSLPADWSIKKLLGNHPSIPYNPDIANTLFRAGMIEAWGRGISKIVDTCKVAGLPAPHFNTSFGGLQLVFRFDTSGSVKSSGKSSVKGSVKGSVKSSVKIITLITDNSEITIPEIADNIGISTRAVEKHIAKLKLEGIIMRVGSDKAGKWKIIKK